MKPTADLTSLRELDHRRTDRIDVSLLWDPFTNGVSVSVCDERSGESLAFNVRPAEALEAFYHPYAYAGEAHEPTRPRAHVNQTRRTP